MGQLFIEIRDGQSSFEFQYSGITQGKAYIEAYIMYIFFFTLVI